jgi:hypothetical protein
MHHERPTPLIPLRPIQQPLKNSTGCVIAWMRCQNDNANRHFGSRAPHLATVEKFHDGIFQHNNGTCHKCSIRVGFCPSNNSNIAAASAFAAH